MDGHNTTTKTTSAATRARWLITVLAAVALFASTLLPNEPAAAGTPSRWGWPIDGAHQVTRDFDPPAVKWGAGHRGVDLAGEVSMPVYAAGGGTVSYAGVLAGRGVVAVTHPNGLKTTYEPVTASVVVGAVVTRGQQIGALEAGHAGCPDAACLHWGLRRGETYLDPLGLLKPRHVRLLPKK
ncbi:peptidase M23-like protein [Antricoccus suffuscus]|uniref:Peptidase M23-like protein n=1 Tax=Antricoccus suffuscus TaxID=1629062 RepID=A0A2T1A4X6_9ACTN|nr:M23 family metallopeptidase [Antricoccus suffuscus]PRZ43547.1 peptidase M23-like protein [Antricoccus suffuscus]